jgi:ABC-type phosphate transport system substrate-binding protein
MKRKCLGFFASVVCFLSISSACLADIAIIANNSVSVSHITTEAAANIFLGKVNALEDGTRVVPVDQDDAQPVCIEFYKKVLKKDAPQLNAYWLRAVFAGEAQPPKKVGDDAAVIALVKANPNIIGFVNASAVNKSVKVLLKVPQ